MTIICGTDFTENAAGAIAAAAALAKKRNETLLLAHVVQPHPADPVEMFSESLRKTYERQLDADAEPLRRDGLVVLTEVAFGSPDLELMALAPANTTLIVVGSGHHRRGTHWLLGSVAERLARCAQHPLLVVRNATSLKHWAEGLRPLQVMVATDLSPASDYALERAALLKDFGACEVELTYVDYPPVEYARLGIGGPLHRQKEHPVVEGVLAHEMRKRAAAVDFGEPVRTQSVLSVHRIGSALAETGDLERADLIVVGAHQRHGVARAWHGSVAHEILHRASTNVLCIPFHGADEAARSLISPRLETIVAATDLTPAGNRSIAWAMALARPGTNVIVTTIAESDNAVNDAALDLTEIVPPESWPKGIKLSMEVIESGDIVSNVCAVAERVGADLIILGRRGGHANEIAASTRRAILIARDDAA